MKLSVSVMPPALGGKQIEEDPLFRMIGKRGIAGCRSDAAVVFGQHVGDGQILALAEAPFLPGNLVQSLGKGLGQPVGKDLGHDRAIIVVVGLAAEDEFVGAQAAGHGKAAHVVLAAAADGRDEVGVAEIVPSRLAQPLLPQIVQPGLFLRRVSSS